MVGLVTNEIPSLKSHRRRGILQALTVFAVLLVAATCQRPDVTTSTQGERVGPYGTVDFVDGMAARQVRVEIPPGLLAEATGGEVTLYTSTGSEAPISAVEFEVGSPASGVTVVKETGRAEADFAWTLPEDCDLGCDVVFPVSVRHIGEGDPPSISWSLAVTVIYDDVNNVPDIVQNDWPAVIEPAGTRVLELGEGDVAESWEFEAMDPSEWAFTVNVTAPIGTVVEVSLLTADGATLSVFETPRDPEEANCVEEPEGFLACSTSLPLLPAREAGTWTATVRKVSDPAAEVRVSVAWENTAGGA